MLVDPVTKAVEADLAKVRAAEQVAYRAKYGKLTPALYERLQTAADDERLSVGIWVAYTQHGRQPEELATEVAQIYPEAAIALREHGAPWAVDNPGLARAIRKAYMERLRASLAARMDPLLAWFAQQGYRPRQLTDMPVLTLTLTKAEIVRVAQQSLVERIYLTEMVSAPASDVATATDRMPSVWRQGINGSGVRIAIVEGTAGGTNINAVARGCLSIANEDIKKASLPDGDHISRVAAIAACSNNNLPGAAQGAAILDGGFDHANDPANAFADALAWAVDPDYNPDGPSSPADVINVSWSTWLLADPGSTELLLADRIADYWARQLWKTIVVAAGNSDAAHGITVSSPGKGWNVLTVGNVDDRNNAHWSDDVMNNTSSYVNPASGVEKPEVAAPGTDISTVVGCPNPNVCTGTSFAAPQVAGLAALMMEAHGDLKTWPSAVKAIILASAFHNIENNDNTEGGNIFIGDKDGAGAIDAAIAVDVAANKAATNACSQPCWWAVNTPPPPGSWADYYLDAVRGERVRVVTAWLSDADGSQWNPTDVLANNYNLHVYRPGDNVNPLISSTSATNNVEMVEFIAPERGRYRIELSRDSLDTDFGNRPAIAWTKQATYLPDVRRNANGWNSTLTIRNDGAEPRDVTVTYFFPDGTFAAGQTYYGLQPNASWSTSLPSYFNNFQGHAVVDGSENLSVSIVTRRNDRAYAASGINPGTVGDPAVEHAETTLFAPALYRNAWNYNSTLFIQNTGGVSANVVLYLIGRAGYPSGSCTFSINPGGRIAQTPDGCVPSLPSPWLGSARIVSTNGQPLAAQILADNPVTANARSAVATAVGSTVLYLPAAYKNKWNTNSGVVVQNLGNTNTAVRLSFYDRTGALTTVYDFSGSQLTPGQAVGLWLPNLPTLPNGWVGSIKVESLHGQPLAVIAQVADADDVYEYTGATGRFGSTVLLPRAAREDNHRTTGFIVLNPNSRQITVKRIYYNVNGTVEMLGPNVALAPHAALGSHQSGDTFLGSGWEGSILLYADGPIVAVMREDDTITLSAAAYNGMLR